MEINLNDIKEFQGLIRNDGNNFKIYVAPESFWVRDCNYSDGVWHGVIDNDLIMTEKHGLKYGDAVKFQLIE